MHKDFSAIPAEEINVLKALRRVKMFSFGNHASYVNLFYTALIYVYILINLLFMFLLLFEN
jgi:hypothetical protein